MNAGAILRELGLSQLLEKQSAGMNLNFLRRMGGVAKGKGFGAYDSKQLAAMVANRRQIIAVKDVAAPLQGTDVANPILTGRLRPAHGRIVPRVAAGTRGATDAYQATRLSLPLIQRGDAVGLYSPYNRVAVASRAGGVPTQRHEIMHGLNNNAASLPSSVRRELPYMTQVTSAMLGSKRPVLNQLGQQLDEFTAQMAGPKTTAAKLRAGSSYLGDADTVQAYNRLQVLGPGWTFARNTVAAPSYAWRAARRHPGSPAIARVTGAGVLTAGAAVGAHGYHGQQQQAADSESRYLDMRQQQLAESRRLSSQIGQ